MVGPKKQDFWPRIDILKGNVFKKSLIKQKYISKSNNDYQIMFFVVCTSVNRVVEFPGAGLGRLITINSKLNGAI